jgi:hypothetical protein
MTHSIVKPGDRIRLVEMPDDPDPLAPGSLGTVAGIHRLAGWCQIDVDWDNGRAQMLACPPDRFEIVDA